MCGGTSASVMVITSPVGLSPRVRGNPRLADAAPSPARSIPACAGEPHPASLRRCCPGVYPRVCGGTAGYDKRLSLSNGLSPRVRGNPRHTQKWTDLGGSIPACAGEPRPGTLSARRCRVYPRVCGGTHLVQRRRYWPYGLSPRVRGNLLSADHLGSLLRSIPACAGEPVTPCCDL